MPVNGGSVNVPKPLDLPGYPTHRDLRFRLITSQICGMMCYLVRRVSPPDTRRTCASGTV